MTELERKLRAKHGPFNSLIGGMTDEQFSPDESPAGLVDAMADSLVENIRTGTENTRDLCFADAMELRKAMTELERKARALDWLGEAVWSPKTGNGIALFPIVISTTGERRISIDDLGEEDGSNLGDSIADGISLLEAIESAMQEEAKNEQR